MGATKPNEPMSSNPPIGTMSFRSIRRSIPLARRPRMSNEVDAAHKHRNKQEQSWICQQRESAAPFKWISVLVGNESDERVHAKDEVRRHAGAFGQEVADEQRNGQPKQSAGVGCRCRRDQKQENSKNSDGRRGSTRSPSSCELD